MRKSICGKIQNNLISEGSVITFCILILLVIANYMKNIKTYSGLDISLMYDHMKIILPSYNNVYDRADYLLLFRLLFPILIVLPASFSYINDEKTGRIVYLVSREGYKRYIYESIVANFMTTFLVFLVPLFLDLFITFSSFPTKAKCDLSNYGLYSREYADMVYNYFFCRLYLYNPYIYLLICIIRICSFAGILSVFPTLLSYMIPFRFRFYLFFPTYIILNGTIVLNYVIRDKVFSTDIYDYILLFNDENKSWKGYYVLVFFIFLADICFLFIGNLRRRKQIGC